MKGETTISRTCVPGTLFVGLGTKAGDMVVLKPPGVAGDVEGVAEPSAEVSSTFSAKWQLLHSGFPPTPRSWSVDSTEPSRNKNRIKKEKDGVLIIYKFISTL